MQRVNLSIFFFLLFFSFSSYSQNGWYVAANNIGTSQTGIFFLDSQTGWISCNPNYGDVYKSTDGGASWFLASSTPFMKPKSICFADPSWGTIAAGAYGFTNYPQWYSANGGDTWDPIAFPYHSGGDLRSVTYFNGQFWLCGTLNTPTIPELVRAAIVQGNTSYLRDTGVSLSRIRGGISSIYSVGNKGVVYKGTNVIPISVGNDSANLSGVSFKDANTGYVVGGKFVYKTTNDGAGWMRLYPHIPEGIYHDVYFLNKDSGWIACTLPGGSTGAMIFTTNGGSSWVQQYSGFAGSEICFVNNLTGWVLCGPNVLKTTTGGNPFAPPVPVPASPPNNSVGLPLNDTLIWSISPGATSYKLQVSTDSIFNSLIVNDSSLTVNWKYVTGLNPLTYYWWRVSAKNSGGSSGFSSHFKFRTISLPTVPQSLVPPNNATNQPTSLTFLWSKAYEVTMLAVSKYSFELFTDTAGTPVIRDTTLIDTLKPVSGLLNNRNYWWRVRAKNIAGWGSFSPFSRFTTVAAPPQTAPNLISPPNNSSGISVTVTLDWTQVTEATAYKVQVSSDSSFVTTQLDSTINRDSIIIPSGRLANNTKYYWRVRAENSGGVGPYSVKFNFTTSLVSNITQINNLPKEFRLYSSYPNPFNPVTKIRFDVPRLDYIVMKLYDILGREVAVLVNEQLQPGTYETDWDAAGFPSGVYFYNIITAGFTQTRKMVLIK
jgi:photosystem II stability/assembly factor-like uncharacterized protein